MRWIMRIIGGLIIAAAVGIGSILLLPGERIARIAADQISKTTGRQVTMEGETRVSFYPILGVSTGRVEIANAEWSDAGPMMVAESFKIGVEPVALFGGDIRITGLEAVNPEIRLERATDGRVNWELGVEGVAASGQSAPDQPARSRALALTLDRALIDNATLGYTDHATGQTTRMQDFDLDLRWPDYAGAATFEAVLRHAGDAVQIGGELDRVGNFIAGGVSALTVSVSAPGGEMSFDGRAGVQPQVDGALSADLSDTERFLAALGLDGAAIPEGLGRAGSLATQATLTEDMRLSLRDTVLRLDNNRFEGAADIDLAGDKPRINAQLRAGALDFSGLAGADSGNGSGGETGWSTASIDASGLALLDGELALVADSVNLGDLQLGTTRTLMTLDRSRAVFELRELRAYDGLVTGEFVANNRSGLSVGGSLTATDLDIQTLLTDALDISRLTGTAEAEFSFLGVGQSVDAIMNSLSGDGVVKTGRGVIEGFDLDRLMRSGDGAGGTTVFDRLTASFVIQDGNLVNDDLLLSLPRARAEGSGRVGLGARDIDYLFTPVLLEGENSRGLAVPVRIRGPWSAPRILPDLQAAIDLNLEAEKDALKDRARDEINRAVERELGVDVQDGQSIKDAFRDTLENEARRGLIDLLD